MSRAFEVLSDSTTRKIYDSSGEAGLKQHAQNGGGQGNGNAFNLFNNFFGQQQQERKGQNMIADVEVTLESIYTGDAMTVSTHPFIPN